MKINRSYKDTPLYALNMTSMENKKSKLSIQKINNDLQHYFIVEIDGQDYVFLENKDFDFPNLHVNDFIKFKANSNDSIYFSDLDRCKSLIENKKLTSINYNNINWPLDIN